MTATGLSMMPSPLAGALDTLQSMAETSRHTWAEQIRASAAEVAATHAALVERTIAMAKLVSAAKTQLGTAYWLEMVEQDLGWRHRSAYYLAGIGESAIAECNAVAHLPASWGTLAQLARIAKPKLEAAIETGEINPGMTRADAVKLVEKPIREASDRDQVLVARDGDPDALVERARRIAADIRSLRRDAKAMTGRESRGVDRHLCAAIKGLNQAADTLSRWGAA
jgi:hypothetical protein